MSSALGPFDRRAQRRRCLRCIRGHLKCNGGFPCNKCLQASQICSPPEPARSTISLDRSHKFSAKTRAEVSHVPITPRIARPVPSDLPSRYIAHLCSSFLVSNSFTGRGSDGLDDVASLFQNSPGLYNASIAVAALDVRRHRIPLRTPTEAVALRFYRAAISAVQAELLHPSLNANDSILWSTFFLGIFELMYDISGEGWIKHILHGTSQLLQYRGPDRHLSGTGRRFFITARIFEISRALIFSSRTFLAQERWQRLMDNMWSGEGAKDWHPKEDLYDLMISCSALCNRAREIVDTIQAQSSDSQMCQAVLRESAIEGHRLRLALLNWKTSALAWSATENIMTDDPQMMLAMIYQHAISIYLSGTFDYFPYWNESDIPTPILSSSQTYEHVRAILGMVANALKETNLAGILFLFPLRVAGARAQTLELRFEIAKMLGDITRRGFVVADAFTIDLEELWQRKSVVV